MSDLRVGIGDIALKNPIIAASSELTIDASGIDACVAAGVGAVVAKSINERPEAAAQLDIADYALLDDHEIVQWSDGDAHMTLFNRSGLAQVAIDNWLNELGDAQARADRAECLIVGSITAASIDGVAAIAARMNEVVRALEVNVGAPHGREAKAVVQLTDAESVAALTARARTAFEGQLIIKLPGQASDPVGMALAAQESGADAVCLMGRFNGFMPDLADRKPVLNSYGAIGGPWALPISLYWVSKSYKQVNVPLIGTNGARSGFDVARFLLAGARAVEMASLPLIEGPDALTRVVEELSDYLAQQGLRAHDLIGTATEECRSYAEIEPAGTRPQPWSRKP